MKVFPIEAVHCSVSIDRRADFPADGSHMPQLWTPELDVQRVPLAQASSSSIWGFSTSRLARVGRVTLH